MALWAIPRWRDARVRSLGVAELREAAAKNPGDSQSHCYLAQQLLKDGHPEDALVEFKSAAGMDPQSARAHLGLGRALEALDRTDEAETEYRESVRLDPESAEAYVALAKRLRLSGSLRESLKLAQRATEVAPLDAEAWHERALSQRDVGDDAGAVASASTAVRIDGAQSRFHATLAGIYSSRHQMVEALAEYERSFQLNPNDGNLCQQAGAFLAANPPDPTAGARSEQLLLRAVRLGTDRPSEAWFSLGQYYLRTDRPKPAVDAFDRAIASGIKDERFYYGLSNAYARLGDHAKMTGARARFLQLSRLHSRMERLVTHLDREPNDSSARLELARIYVEYGLYPLARRQYALYLRQNPFDGKAASEMQSLPDRAASSPSTSR